jgi:hypothetical protein
MDEPAATRLADAEVEEALQRLDRLLGRIEALPGDDGETARDAVSLLAQVYGEALARAIAVAASTTDAAAALSGDQLVSHLLALHGIHPQPLQARVERSVMEMRQLLHDDTIRLVGVQDGVAHVVVPKGGCGSEELTSTVRDILLGVAPDLEDVQAVSEAPAVFIPLQSLRRRPARY